MVEKVHALTDRSGTWQETTTLVSKVNRTLRGMGSASILIRRPVFLDQIKASFALVTLPPF